MDPKTIETTSLKTLKSNAETHRHLLLKIRKPSRCWLPFWNNLREPFVPWHVCFATCFPDPLGYTLAPFGHSLEHPWSSMFDILKESGSKLAPRVKDSRATNGTTHTFKNTSTDSNKRYRSSAQTFSSST